MTVEVGLVNEICAMGWVDRLHVAVWRGNGVAEAHTFYREMKAGIARFGWGIGHLAVIEPGTPLPPPDIRKIIVRVFDEYPGAVGGVSVACEGQGFFGSAVRSVATGLMMLAKTPVPFRLSGSVVDSAAFLSTHVAAGAAPLEPAAVVGAVQELRHRMRTRVAKSA
ncbi:hypothetical protein [Sorangium cellulosum]|uniref:Uncharacterized protein n=2 Tax=Sorangium cellulosum TaxID=56 RepID=S4XVP6_SORCE|nr:hypothetical protein [Sorangium cellulosum]AGP34683.1 hypothetical protein SCE1572_09280 [Sorangium cellulosum So0157-2]